MINFGVFFSLFLKRLWTFQNIFGEFSVIFESFLCFVFKFYIWISQGSNINDFLDLLQCDSLIFFKRLICFIFFIFALLPKLMISPLPFFFPFRIQHVSPTLYFFLCNKLLIHLNFHHRFKTKLIEKVWRQTWKLKLKIMCRGIQTAFPDRTI